MGTPNADNLYVGAGNVYFNRLVAGVSSGFRHLGNVESLAIASAITEITKKSSMEGARGIMKRLVVGTDVSFTMRLNEYDIENIALALLGETSAISQGSTVTAGEINGGNAIEFDKWYDLGGFNPTVTSVSQGSPLTVDVDYEVDAVGGLVRILSTGSGTEAVTTWNGTLPDVGGRQIFALSSARIVGALRYVSAADQTSGPLVQIDAWRVSIQPSGDLQLISEDFGAFDLKGSVELDTSHPAGQRYYRYVETSGFAAVGS